MGRPVVAALAARPIPDVYRNMISAELYETDFYEWTQHNAELLRSGNIQEADLTHVAEELEDMGDARAT